MLTILINVNVERIIMTSPRTKEAGWLTAAEAAAQLGVKRQTLYAYVSRGLLTRIVDEDGRTSRYDPAEIERLRRQRRPAEGELTTAITTAITRVDDHTLLVRGRDLVQVVDEGATFVDVVNLLWDAPSAESWELGGDSPDHGSVLGSSAFDGAPLDALRTVVAARSAADPLRHELSDKGVRAVGRRLIVAMAQALPPTDGRPPEGEPLDSSIAGSLWRRLSARPAAPPMLASLDAALGLLVDHGMASSTFAARIAASVRADPYSVVSAGLGVLGGTLHGAASAAVHEMLTETERTDDAAQAAGEARRRLGGFPGFGHAVYETQDPRYGALIARIVEAWADDPRLVNVYRVRDVIGERAELMPNVDLALGALTYLAHMPTDAGEVIFATARTAGWLAHAMEEYRETPLRFRPRARYVGP